MQYGYTEQLASPLRGPALEELKAFLARAGLTYAPGIEHTALVRDVEGTIIASASLEGSVIKCVAVDEARRGEDLTAAVLTALTRRATEEGRRRLFLYTKPENRTRFLALGFFEVAQAGEVLFMENRRGGFDAWAASLPPPPAGGIAGAVVMNANPMTLGHRYLAEQAASRCDFLYVFVVSEDRSAVPAAERLAIVREAMADLPHTVTAGTGAYLISSATFPDYFLKDKARTGEVWSELDAAVFCRLARRLGITRRFVGSEPFCPVTAAYNQTMARLFPAQGVELIELPRLEREGTPVSATAVRALAAAGRWEELQSLVPEAVRRYFAEERHRAQFLARLEPSVGAPLARFGNTE